LLRKVCFGIKYFIINLFNFPTVSSPPLFYPFGTGAGDTVCPKVDDTNSSVINLTSPFSFFGRSYPQIYVNHNGFLTFDQASSNYTPIQFNSSYSGRDIIAPFWTDIDNRLNGIISYNLYTVGNVLSRATQDINQYFTGVSLSALWVFVATWDKVAYYNNSGTESSFQVVLISTGSSSFVLMNYGVIAGYASSTQNFTILWETNKVDVNLSSSSNVGIPGRWAFWVNGAPDNSITTSKIFLGINTKHTVACKCIHTSLSYFITY
uniref:NIDO domain-containing protein n=1 Tax=Astyanax mexicanus TaxID=7994 RepID=W5L7L6_ASTMX